ncbi:uncharacterized protein K441DRAFT_271846 [Cenococcum geophilum 1.58]|uniref:uncharacterized protein n=1 Tax=Cenococcum geophilum 1.58 TaxID=794803 RepID=UPI00358DE8D9|nr:hypothetical protein K441DRAFT_271846 [Cenococcum geophilum 1.58]
MARCGNISELQDFLRFYTSPHDSDVVFIATDFERHQCCVTDIGISTLDTRDLSSNLISKAQKAIQTRHICVKDTVPGWVRKIFDKNPEQVRAEAAEWIQKRDIKATLADIFCITDTKSIYFNQNYPRKTNTDRFNSLTSHTRPATLEFGPLRSIVLVSHHLERDLLIMKKLGFNQNDVAPIIGYLDTRRLAKEAGIGSSFELPITLKELLKHFGLHQKLLRNVGGHLDFELGNTNAGIRAAMTIHAMLLIALDEFNFTLESKPLGWLCLGKISALRALERAAMQMQHDGKTKHAHELTQLTRDITIQGKNVYELTGAITDNEPQQYGSVSVSLLLVTAWRRLKEGSESPAIRNVMNRLKALVEEILDTDDFINAVVALPIYYAMAPKPLESSECSNVKKASPTHHESLPNPAISISPVPKSSRSDVSCSGESFSGSSRSNSFSDLSRSDIVSTRGSHASMSLKYSCPALEFPCGPGRPVNLWSLIE